MNLIILYYQEEKNTDVNILKKLKYTNANGY